MLILWLSAGNSKGTDFLGTFWFGCFIGLWIHFIPCAWWTCDWGEYDGAGVRGGIWFVLWAIVSGVSCCRKAALKCISISIEGSKTIRVATGPGTAVSPSELVDSINSLIRT